MDIVCEKFSKYLYEGLLNNYTIEHAFEDAKDRVIEGINTTDVSN